MRSTGAKAGALPYSLRMAPTGIATAKTADYEGVLFRVPGVVTAGWDSRTIAVWLEAKEWLGGPVIQTPKSLEAQPAR